MIFQYVGKLSFNRFSSDKANKLDVGNAVNPYPSEDDNKLVVVKSPNAVNPLVWDYSVRMSLTTSLASSCFVSHKGLINNC